jgi:hypothetical protein
VHFSSQDAKHTVSEPRPSTVKFLDRLETVALLVGTFFLVKAGYRVAVKVLEILVDA